MPFTHSRTKWLFVGPHSRMLDELDTIEQCLSYDTTFQIGDFYVSALIVSPTK